MRVAQNGREALELIAAHHPSLILSDILMPEMNGYALCQAVKAAPATAHIPVFLVTALNDAMDIVRGIECGADNFVRKPYEESYLLERIAQALRQPRDTTVEAGTDLYLGGQKVFVNASRQKILDLLISTYEQAVQVNIELHARERQVIDLNMRLSHHARDLEQINREIEVKNEQLADANRMKSAFIANMSHELRTPLNAILGFTGALLMRLPGPLTVEQDKQLNIVRSSGRHLLSLINDILDVTKLESGKTTMANEPVQCQDLLLEMADIMRPLAVKKGLGLAFEVPPETINISSDRRALAQILINLINNAIKFTEQGAVRVTLSQRGALDARVTEFSVHDTGTGIRGEDQSKLFQAFTQLDATSTRNAEGAGLGLYLSQNLANMLGGSLSLQSEFGHGSIFTLTLSA